METEVIIISVAAFFTAILTFFSGFGLGTILTPVFMVFFPVDLAIGLTGIVHFFNNVFKLALIGKKADRPILVRFGIPAVLAAIVGAWVLLHIPDVKPLFQYNAFGKSLEVYPVKFVISILLIFFAILDLIPFLNRLQFDKRQMPLGGILSGFFGGLSGNQGALRSAFLIRAGLTKEEFIATTVVISCFVDFTRLSVYATRFTSSGLGDNLTLVVIATLSAIAGAFIGNRLLKKVTLKFVQTLVAVMLILISVALGAGWI
ncbi:MAG TPA: sulfite exporter TauE/SafE family protein [Flavobacteriaceae bacterium]|mgnify:CR=1 FL=1|nr:sulfite exporter TauE/SafE family protein [Flavobacteriaceae bacterium]HPF12597.1 sulfite exporter TauE/SafE family protein [Flavobacteriaceae bacterium]HQU22409.1 sulfite exporter TauE/SafE family protein [Flavobacteriaceae bacterium]HQU66340.1 sulfite exporter TauE/SafE family protein [Flavobacteriaceae bacterium]HRW43678.1 sulfite exporter TauE/SafE family protein [Flavobacteriaceae bacterium]